MLKNVSMPINNIFDRPMHDVMDRFFDVDNSNDFYVRSQTQILK